MRLRRWRGEALLQDVVGRRRARETGDHFMGTRMRELRAGEREPLRLYERPSGDERVVKMTTGRVDSVTGPMDL